LTTTFFVYLRRRCTRVIDQQWLSVAMTCSERSLQRRHGLMKKSFVISVLAGVVLPMARLNSRASAQNGNPVNSGSANETTLAVFGDWPYGTNLLDSAPLLIDSINADPSALGDARRGHPLGQHAVHRGARRQGADRARDANPSWNQRIFNLFEQFKDPVVYTPGDNEWTDTGHEHMILKILANPRQVLDDVDAETAKCLCFSDA